MEEKKPLLTRLEPPEENAHGSAPSPSPSPEHPSTESRGHPIIGSPGHPNSSMDCPSARTTDAKDCGECLAAMTHRLAQPMTALRGGIELALMSKRTAADYRSLLEQSLQLADDMAQLIVSLRDIGASASPAGPPQSILLGATAAEVLTEMQGMADSRGIRLQLRTERAVKVCADPERLREALLSLLAWVVQNSAGGEIITVEIAASEGEALLSLSPPRLDIQYLQIKVLEDITTPGLFFSHAAKNGALGWAANQRLVKGLGGKLEILTDGIETGCVRVRFPLAPAN